uniref:Uncharacterized protein n=1 Tax=Mola mola TaxID=94237 RepID=A0A3Q3VJG2_MOLML
MGESQVEDLVTVFFQRLNLHTGDTVKQAPELSVPRHGRCTKTQARYPVVSVEQLPPKELISGHSQPLSAGQASAQHGIMGQTQEDLQHQAIRQNWDTLHPNILRKRTYGRNTGVMSRGSNFSLFSIMSP